MINSRYLADKKKALYRAKGKPCVICGAPSSCAVLDWGNQPVCIDHGFVAQKLGYIVAFPDPPIVLNHTEKPDHDAGE